MKMMNGVCAVFIVLTLAACGGGGGTGTDPGAVLISAPKGSSSHLSAAAVTLPDALAAIRPNAGDAVSAEPLVNEQVFDWAESKFLHLFPGQEATKAFQQFEYRYYAATDLYLGIAAGEVYMLGPLHTSGRMVRIAAIGDFASRIGGCAQAVVVDKLGQAILPVGATDAELPEDVNTDAGSLASKYPGLDTTTDGFYAALPCEQSIGGTLPPDDEPSADVLAAQEYLDHFEATEGQKFVNEVIGTPAPPLSTLEAIRPGDCFIRSAATAASPLSGRVDCNDRAFLNAAMPFEGRDIIYVHGLDTAHLADRIHNPTGPASAVWPSDSAAFTQPGGYFRAKAEAYWLPHIIEHLGPPASPGGPGPWPGGGWQWLPTDTAALYAAKSNRYLIVAWSSNQTIEYAQHALLTQIQLAITSHLNVVTPTNYPSNQIRPFCSNGCVVVGHSTGPLITSSAFGVAAAGVYGPGAKQITNHIAAHVSMDGAISGSRIASIGVALALGGAPPVAASNVLCPVVDQLFGTTNACNADLAFVVDSILRDLIPAVAQGLWRDAINASPVPTVTLAGGHPRGNQAGGATQWFLPGVDDGVVTMNSACGNPNPVFPGLAPPSGILVTQMLKAFEFSTWAPRLARGVKLLVSQKNTSYLPQPGYLASACTPWLSAAGMVMPVAYAWEHTTRDPRSRYRNHYSFLQGLAEHSYDGGGSPLPALWPSYVAGSASVLREYEPSVAAGVSASGLNVEESRAVTDPEIYTREIDANGTRLVKFLDMRVLERGRTIKFNMPLNIGNCVKKSPLKYHCTRWIWKRTYHLAEKWEQKQSSHYVYEYVARR